MPTEDVAPGTIITYAGGAMGVSASSVQDDIRRCQLDLSAFSPGGAKLDKSNVNQNELDAALKSEEANCGVLRKGHSRNAVFAGFPKKAWYGAGKWYSGSFTFTYGVCDAVSKAGADYRPTEMSFILSTTDRGPKLLLAKWEVQEAD